MGFCTVLGSEASLGLILHSRVNYLINLFMVYLRTLSVAQIMDR
jgi:hypothetical protein